MKVIGKTVVEVEWEDAWGNHEKGWTLEEIQAEKALLMKSVGVLVKDDAGGVAVASDHPIQNDRIITTYRDVHFIPRGMVKKMKVLR